MDVMTLGVCNEWESTLVLWRMGEKQEWLKVGGRTSGLVGCWIVVLRRLGFRSGRGPVGLARKYLVSS